MLEFTRTVINGVKQYFFLFLDKVVEWTGWLINSTFGWYTGKPIEPIIATWIVWGGIIGISVGSVLLWKFFGATYDD